MKNIKYLKENILVGRVVEELSGQHIEYYRYWNGWVPVLCPFHYDENPSASVNTALGKFKCHACDPFKNGGRAGDVIDLAKAALDTDDTKEAMEWLTEKFL